MDRSSNKSHKNTRPLLVRGADGRLKRAGSESEIADIWAHQKRLQAAETVRQAAQQRRLAEIKREHGYLGLLSEYASAAIRSLKVILFGATASQAGWGRTHLHIAWADIRSRGAFRALRDQISIAVHACKGLPTRTRIKLIGSVGLLCLLFLAVVHHSSPDSNPKVASPSNGERMAAPNPDALPRGTPSFKTVTPSGADVREYGGWTRVSPPGRDPVYAFTDKIGEIPVTISQQPLPEQLKHGNTSDAVAQLAKQFGASRKLSIGPTTAYLGASVKGPQSIVMTKNNLLILVKSAAPLMDDQWIAYLSALR